MHTHSHITHTKTCTHVYGLANILSGSFGVHFAANFGREVRRASDTCTGQIATSLGWMTVYPLKSECRNQPESVVHSRPAIICKPIRQTRFCRYSYGHSGALFNPSCEVCTTRENKVANLAHRLRFSRTSWPALHCVCVIQFRHGVGVCAHA